MKAIIFDTETTGLPFHRRAALSLQPRVIEFGAVIIDHTGAELDSYNVIIDPEVDALDPIITKITGLTLDDLVGKPKWKDEHTRILKLFSGCDLVAAHNLPFDMMQLDFEAQRLGFPWFPGWPRLKLCTVQENVLKWGHRPKLLDLYEHVMGHPLAQTHRALDDCRALAEVVLKENYIARFHDAAIARAN